MGGVTAAAAAKACDDLLAHVLARGSTDNLTVILIIPGPPPAVSAEQLGTPQHSFYHHHTVHSNSMSSVNSSVRKHASPKGSSAHLLTPDLAASTEIDLPAAYCTEGVDAEAAAASPQVATSLSRIFAAAAVDDDDEDDSPICSAARNHKKQLLFEEHS